MIGWQPATLVRPPNMVSVPTAWDEMELGLESLVNEFCSERDSALEFGVDYGYSIVALSNYFKSVVGVDTFLGDPHAGYRENLYAQTMAAIEPYKNICLMQSDWELWAEKFNSIRFDLIHIDIYHTYEQTYPCGLWAIEHSPVVIFHDTIAFPEVKRAIEDLAKNTGATCYEWHFRHGLGILVR